MGNLQNWEDFLIVELQVVEHQFWWNLIGRDSKWVNMPWEFVTEQSPITPPSINSVPLPVLYDKLTRLLESWNSKHSNI